MAYDSMGRRIKVEFDDGQGGKYTISLTGTLSKDKVLKMMDMMEILSGQEDQFEEVPTKDSTFSRLCQMIEDKFPLGTFTSNDVLEMYEDTFHKPIKLSTISTYLSRLADRGVLRRRKTSSGWVYRRAPLKIRR